MSQSLTERCGDWIAGVLSCYDRVVITARCQSDLLRRGGDLYANGIRIFDYPQFAQTRFG